MTEPLRIQQPLVFRGRDDVTLLERIEVLRLGVWSEFISTTMAIRRFGLDPFDREAWHIVYLEGDNVIASGRLIIATCQSAVPDHCSFSNYHGLMSYPSGILNRLVVDRRYRRRGMANRINRDRIRLAEDNGVRDLWIEIQSDRLSAMEQLGFSDVGPSLDESVGGQWRIMRRTA